MIREAADSSVAKTFAILGVDVNDPADVEEFRQDLRFSGRMRQAVDRGMIAATGAIFVAIAAALWAGIAGKIAGE